MVFECFNPCFIGTYSITIWYYKYKNQKAKSFNPCFIGTYSITCLLPLWYKLGLLVLILVLLELTLLLIKVWFSYVRGYGFNPCFIGTYSITELDIKTQKLEIEF